METDSSPEVITCVKMCARIYKSTCAMMRRLGRPECVDCKIGQPAPIKETKKTGKKTQVPEPHPCPSCKAMIKNFSSYCKPCMAARKLPEPDRRKALAGIKKARTQGTLKRGRHLGYKKGLTINK